MPKVRFLPSEEEIEVKTGENLLKVAIRSKVDIQYSCGGAPSCAMCKVIVRDGEEYLNKIEGKELELLGNTYFLTQKRLACQTWLTEEGRVDLELAPDRSKGNEEVTSSFRKPESEWKKTEGERRESVRRPLPASKHQRNKSFSKGKGRPGKKSST
jgi:ferredoxin